MQIIRVPTPLRTYGVYCRESTDDTEQVVFEVALVTVAAFPGATMDHFFVRLSFSKPTIGT